MGKLISVTTGMARPLALILATAAAACSGVDGADSPATTPAPEPPPYFSQSPQEIADLIYSGLYRVPEGFYSELSEPPPPGASEVITLHLKNTHIVSAEVVAPHLENREIGGAAGPDAGAAGYELCTDDWAEALAWSDDVARRARSYSDLVATNVEPRFFEFVRVPRSNPTALLRHRVFQCAYLDRSSADVESFSGSGGQLNRRPVTPADARELAEYLWHFTPYNNYGSAILKSAGESSNGSLGHDLTIATLTRAQVPGTCDRIDVLLWTHAIDSATGTISRTLSLITSFQSREDSGEATLCEMP
jgi:hypothetical protein